MLNVGVQPEGSAMDSIIFSVVSVWTQMLGSDDDASKGYLSFEVSNRLVRIPTRHLDTVFTYSMATDGRTCMILVPYECRLRRDVSHV